MPDHTPTGRDVAEIVKVLVRVQNNPAALEIIKDITTSCLQWGNVLQTLMTKIEVLYVRKPNSTVTSQTFDKIARGLKNGKAFITSIKLPVSYNHVFTIEPVENGLAHVLHAWQDRHTLRVEGKMPVDELVGYLRRLHTLDFKDDQMELKRVFGKVFGTDNAAEIKDIGTSARRRISYEHVIEGKPNGPLTSSDNLRRLSSFSSDLSEWHSTRSSSSSWRSARSSSSSSRSARSSFSEFEGGQRGRSGVSMRWGTGVGAGLGFVFGAGGVLLVSIWNGEDIDYKEAGLAGLKSGVAGGAGGAAGAGVAKLGGTLVRANAAAGVAMFGVFAIWDVVEWKMEKITYVQLRQRLAEGSAAAAGGITGAAVGAAGGAVLGPPGAVAGAIVGGIGGGIGGMFAGRAIDRAIWDESEDAVMNSYEFFGWHDVKRNTRPKKTASEMGRAYDKKLKEKPAKINKKEWNQICMATLMVLLPAMYPEFKKLMKIANDLREEKSNGISSVATIFYEYFTDE